VYSIFPATAAEGEFSHEPILMTKEDAVLCPVTVRPVEPNVYGYGFSVDGMSMPDLSNTSVRLGSVAFESQVEVPG
jgi:hypothetical protein